MVVSGRRSNLALCCSTFHLHVTVYATISHKPYDAKLRFVKIKVLLPDKRKVSDRSSAGFLIRSLAVLAGLLLVWHFTTINYPPSCLLCRGEAKSNNPFSAGTDVTYFVRRDERSASHAGDWYSDNGMMISPVHPHAYLAYKPSSWTANCLHG